MAGGDRQTYCRLASLAKMVSSKIRWIVIEEDILMLTLDLYTSEQHLCAHEYTIHTCAHMHMPQTHTHTIFLKAKEWQHLMLILYILNSLNVLLYLLHIYSKHNKEVFK